ncbi:vitamin B12-dependent ribonucleotide reductase, partial [bacterium]|nr:vitamin B12-dependent ribonucleotide reductase [bacterium]
PYDSEEGRAQAAVITALMTGHAYSVSAKLAKKVGPFAGYAKDKDNMLKVIRMHRDAISDIDASLVGEDLLDAATSSWDDAVNLGELYGIRNSQASLLAPTGTIGLMMDCDTTGIEPDLGLVKVKKLVGGGTMSIVNQTVPRALTALGYSKDQVDAIIRYIDTEKTILGAPEFKKEHENVFACSMGDNPISHLGHVKMMAAVQPFLSGAISKTVNMPETATVEDIEELHIQSWKMGLKAVAIYRDNCKVAQPLSMAKKDGDKADVVKELATEVATVNFKERKELPRVRTSRTYKFQVSDLTGYFTIGEYSDGSPGELFINVSKQGSTLSGLMDSLAISISNGLQFGVPLKKYVKALKGTSFAPAGITDDPEIRTASSITDYILRRLAKDYLSFDDQLELGIVSIDDLPENQLSLIDEPKEVEESTASGTISVDLSVDALEKNSVVSDINAPLCYNCGNQTQRSGSCYVCSSCGSTTGCS